MPHDSAPRTGPGVVGEAAKVPTEGQEGGQDRAGTTNVTREAGEPAAKTFAGRDAILAADDLPTEDVWVPEWNTHVRIRALTPDDRDTWEASMVILDAKGAPVGQNAKGMRARLVVRCIINPDTGERMFSDEDAAILGSRKNGTAVDRLYGACVTLSKLSKKDLEEAAGNSDTSRSAGS